MKTMKKLISVLLALSLIAGCAAVLGISAAAEDEFDPVAYEFNPVDRDYGYGQWAQTAHYTDNGYVIVYDEGRYSRQYQLCYHELSDEANQKIFDAAVYSDENYNGSLAIDATLIAAESSKEYYTDAARYNANAQLMIIYQCKYVDKDGVQRSADLSFKNYIYFGKTQTFKVYFDELVADVGDPSSFKINNIVLQIMDYDNLAFSTDETLEGYDPALAGKAGLTNIEIAFSHVYVPTGDYTPVMGEDLGEQMEFIPNEEDAEDAGTFSFYDGELVYKQDSEPGDGMYGNGGDIERTGDVKYGDANGDDKVTAADVLLIRKYLAKWDVKDIINEANADANADGKVTAADVLLIRKSLAKWDVELGPQK